ncbi:MAG: hypothetical protein ACPGU4_14185, partial [Flavobacteriales bacterium]
AYAMVTVYGLSDKIGNISYYDSSGQSEYSFSKPYSEKTAELIDKEVSDLVESAYVRTKNILIENRDKLEKLAEELLEKEVIFKENLEEIFGKRQWEKPEVTVPSKNGEAAKPESPVVNAPNGDGVSNTDAAATDSLAQS